MRLYRCVKIGMVKILQIFGRSSISPNLSGTKVSLHTIMDILLHLQKWDVTFKTKDISKNIT